jgi:hypothetical protein
MVVPDATGTAVAKPHARPIGPLGNLARIAAMLAMLPGIAAAPFPAAAQADKYDLARLQYPELFQVYYDEGVMEYCGLLDRESAVGFVRRRDQLLAASQLSETTNREVRIAGSIAADMEYDNHGLAQSHWCDTAGKDAYNRFVAVYRAGSKDGGADPNGNNSDKTE